MEPSSQPQPAIGDATGGSQLYPTSAYPPAATVAGSSAYPPVATVAVAPGVAPAGSQPAPPFPANPAQLNAQNQLIYEQAQQFNQQQRQQQQRQQQQRQLQQFWAERLSEIEQVTDFKNHILPLARIKKIMTADEDVRMISVEAPVVFAKACEIFILELTLRSWMHTEENKRRTLQKNNLAAAITRTNVYDFLVDIFPRDEMREEGIEHPRAGQPPLGPPADVYPYYYPLQLQVPGAVMGHGSQQMPQGHPTYAWHDPHEQQQQGHLAEQQQSTSG